LTPAIGTFSNQARSYSPFCQSAQAAGKVKVARTLAHLRDVVPKQHGIRANAWRAPVPEVAGASVSAFNDLYKQLIIHGKASFSGWLSGFGGQSFDLPAFEPPSAPPDDARVIAEAVDLKRRVSSSGGDRNGSRSVAA